MEIPRPVPAVGTSTASVPQALGLQPGQTVHLRVTGQTSQEGMTPVQIAGHRLEARLPVPAAPGDTLQLKVLTLEPRLSFALPEQRTTQTLPATPPFAGSRITTSIPANLAYTPAPATPEGAKAVQQLAVLARYVAPLSLSLPQGFSTQSWQIGQPLTAQVLAPSAPEGTTLLRLEGQPVAVRLPMLMQPGNAVDMRVFTATPQPSLRLASAFSLLQTAPSSTSTATTAPPVAASVPATQLVTAPNITPAPPSTVQAATPSTPLPSAPQAQAAVPVPTQPAQQVIPINTPVPPSLASQLMQPGQSLQAQVIGTSAQTGTTLVQVNNQSVELRLPIPVNPGQVLELKVLTPSPRPALGVVVNTPAPALPPTPSAPAPQPVTPTNITPAPPTAQMAVPPTPPPSAPQAQAAAPAPTTPTQQVIPINTPVPPSLASQLMQPGQSLQAQVIGTSAQTGTTLVQVNNQSVELRLPIPVNPGQALELKVLTLSPRPTLGVVVNTPAPATPVPTAPPATAPNVTPTLPSTAQMAAPPTPQPSAPQAQAVVPTPAPPTQQVIPINTPVPSSLASQLIQPGQTLQAQVMGTSAQTGTTLVQVNNQSVELRLPIPVNPGQALELKVLTLSPRPALGVVVNTPVPAPATPVPTAPPATTPVTAPNATPIPPATTPPTPPPNAPQTQAAAPAPTTPPTQQVIPINTPVPPSLASQLIQPGQSLQAQVMGTSAQTGTTLVQVNNQSVELRLPIPVNPSQALELRVLTLSPRPTLGLVVNTPIPQTTPPAQTAPLPTPSAPAPAATTQTAATPQAATPTPPTAAPAPQVQAAVPSNPPNAPQIQAAAPAPATQQVISINTPVPPSLASQLIQPGQTLQAQVIGTSAQTGTTLVQVNNQSVELRLPVPVNPGQTLELRVLTLSPRPTLGMVIPMPAVSSPVVNAPPLPTGLNPVLAQAPPQAPLMQTALTPTAIVPPSTTVTGQTNPLSTPLAATSVAPNTVLLSLPPTLSTQQWQAGQVMTLHALGHSARDGTTLMQLGQQAVAARLPMPMAAGESVALRVVSSGPQPVLTLANPVPAATPQASVATPQASVATPPAVASPPSPPVFSPEMANALARQVRQSLPVQSAQLPLLELLNQLASQQQGKAQNLLPEQIKQLNEVLLRLLPTPAQVAQAEGLRKAILRSGMFYESRIQAISSTDSVSAPLQDLKSILLSLAERLRSMPNPPPALLRSLYQEGMRRAAELPPPRREGSPTPQARAAPVDLALFSREALLEMLKIRTQGALSRVVLHQVANAESAEQGQARWLMELPLRAQNAMELIHLLLEKDAQQGGKEDKDPTWRAEMALDLPELGAVRIRVTVCGDQVSTHFWAETPSTVKRLGESLPRLREGLTARELQIGNMGCYAGEPPPTTPPAEQARKGPQGMVDSHV